MTAWNPIWTITINGVNYTSLTVANLKINSGRTSIDTQAVASYANVELINLTGSAVVVEIGNSLTITVQNASASPINLFGGEITDLTVAVQNSGSVGISQIIRITALGALAKLPKALTNGVLSRAFDGDQVWTILSELLLNSWNEVSASQTWANYDPTITWSNAENLGLGEIDRPGQYELTDRASSITDMYSLVSALATSGIGYLYEDSNGNIGYADALHRQTYFLANGYIQVSANASIGPGISITKQSGTVKNKVTVIYKNNLSETASDTTSISTFGLLAQSITTSLHNQTDAANQASRYLQLRSYPRFQLSNLTFPIQNPELTDANRNSLLAIFSGMPIKVTDLPANMLGGQFTGYIEGWSWTATVNGLWLNMFATPREFSEVSQKWSDVTATEAWNTISVTLKWQDAIGVIS